MKFPQFFRVDAEKHDYIIETSDDVISTRM